MSEREQEHGASIQDALNRVGRRLNVHDVRALEELDAVFRESFSGAVIRGW